jgi:hypothetical protein
LPTTVVEEARNRYGLACRFHGSDSEQAVEAKANLVATKIVAFVTRNLADAPELSDQQVDRIVRSLAPIGVAARWRADVPSNEFVGNVGWSPSLEGETNQLFNEPDSVNEPQLQNEAV